MIYKETSLQTITYDQADVLSWVRKFAAQQLAVGDKYILDEDIVINQPQGKELTITVSVKKEVTNKKVEVEEISLKTT